MKNLILDPKWADELFGPDVDPELEDLILDCEGYHEDVPGVGPLVRGVVESALFKGAEEIIRTTYKINILAKEESYMWYEVKDFLLRKFVELKPGFLCWGVGKDQCENYVLYVDLPGIGQVSFHVFWKEKELDQLPRYPYEWCGVVNLGDACDSARVITV